MGQGINALASAALLKQSPGRSNMSNYEDIFAGPSAGHVPSAHEQMTGDANSDMAATALGAGPAFHALQAAFDQQRLQDQESSLNLEDDLRGGRPQRIAGMQHAASNDLADMDSEAAAGRERLPNASLLHERNVNELTNQNSLRYLLPAQVEAEGRLGAARTTAQGRVDASTAGLAQKGLQAALLEMLQSGKVPSQDEVTALKQRFSTLTAK